MNKTIITIPEPPVARIIFADTRIASLWLLARVYVGWILLAAGWEKVTSPAWVGPQAGVALKGFIATALPKTLGEHPAVQEWYATVLSQVVLNHTALFSHVVAYGELLVGIALILGIFTGIAAFFGTFMNLNYLFAGTVSLNPIMALLQLFLILAWRTAGWYGIDRYLLPMLGTPWRPGEIFKGESK